MIIQETDGIEERYILRYNRFDININSYQQATEIFPNEEYWKDKIALEKVKEKFSEEQLHNPFTRSVEDLSTRYWLTKEDHSRFSSLLEDLGIAHLHLDNLAVVVMYYNLFKLDTTPTRVALAKELEKALDFVDVLKEPGYDFLRISVKGGFPISLNPRKHTNDKPYSFKHPWLMRAMKQTFINWTKTSPDYWNVIGKYAFLLNHVKSPADVLKFKQEEIMIWVYDYIADNGLSDSHQNASYLTGKLLQTYVDYLPTKKHYKSNVEQKGSFSTYDEYLSNHMRTAIKRVLIERGRTIRFKKEN